MLSNKIEKIKIRMSEILSQNQMQIFCQIVHEVFYEEIVNTDKDYIKLFIFAKKAEGKSNRTIAYYSQILYALQETFNNLCNASTDDIRNYLFIYQQKHNCSATTIDNIRRVFSSFYTWMENEDYIIKSPMKRILKVKLPSTVKTVYTEENIIKMRESFINDKRNLAIIDLLSSSGIRVGELVSLNRSDINLNENTAIVYGKGAKECYIYFDTQTKLSLRKYLDEREDDESALFITKRKYTRNDNRRHRISISQIEKLIHECGEKTQNIKAYPHKFRRTFATKAIDKAMTIEQVQVLLGHTKIDTTLKYAQIQQKNVQYAYNKYIL